MTDIRVARAAGIAVIAVDFGYSDVPVAELGPDRVISHFDQLADACAELLAGHMNPVRGPGSLLGSPEQNE